jgi:hypothetical protein
VAVVVLAVLVLGGIAAVVAGGRDGGDPDAERERADRRAVVVATRALVAAAAVPPEGRGTALCDRLTAGTREQLDALLELASSSPARHGCDVAVAEAPWRLRPITADRERADAASWDVRVAGDRATVDRGGAAPLRLLRVDGRWQADLQEDPVWTHRARLAAACSRAGRAAAGLAPPAGTRAGLREYLGRNARILEILARRVARERSPAGFAAVDRRIASTTRAAARRMRASARSVPADPDRLERLLRRAVDGGGFDLVAQLPGSVSRRFARVVGSCYQDTAVAVDPGGMTRFDRRCERLIGGLLDRPGPRTLPDAAVFYRGVASTLGRVASALRPVLVSRVQEPVVRGVISRVRVVQRIYRGLARDALAGRLPGPEAATRAGFAGTAADLGLRQLGARCSVPEPGGSRRTATPGATAI